MSQRHPCNVSLPPHKLASASDVDGRDSLAISSEGHTLSSEKEDDSESPHVIMICGVEVIIVTINLETL